MEGATAGGLCILDAPPDITDQLCGTPGSRRQETQRGQQACPYPPRRSGPGADLGRAPFQALLRREAAEGAAAHTAPGHDALSDTHLRILQVNLIDATATADSGDC